MKKERPKFRVGDRVIVRGQRRIAYIRAFADYLMYRLDRTIDGFSVWNVADLRPAPRKGGRAK